VSDASHPIATPVVAALPTDRARQSAGSAFVAALGRSPLAATGGAILLAWTVCAIFAPWIAPYPPNKIDPRSSPIPGPPPALAGRRPSRPRHPLALIWGARTVLTVAPIAVIGAAALGTILGLLSGYRGGIVDTVIMRVGDTLLAFPKIILYLIIIAKFGASAFNIIAVITVTQAPIIARIVRGVTLDVKNRDYVAAARMRGESHLFIMLVEILPNARGPLIVDFFLRLGYTTIAIGVLGFLGVGLPPPDPDWGGMVKEAYGMIFVWPHMTVIPALAISSLVVGATSSPPDCARRGSMPDALVLENVTIDHVGRRGTQRILTDLSLRVGEGEALALVGESGCGKSTVALAAMRYLPRGMRITAGRILVDGRDIAAASEPNLRRCAATASRWSTRIRCRA
jgi:peptide/nickel transport system permease protein